LGMSHHTSLSTDRLLILTPSGLLALGALGSSLRAQMLAM
jgi:hypothetical protein